MSVVSEVFGTTCPMSFERQSGGFGTCRAVNGSIRDFVVGFVNNHVHAITEKSTKRYEGEGLWIVHTKY